MYELARACPCAYGESGLIVLPLCQLDARQKPGSRAENADSSPSRSRERRMRRRTEGAARRPDYADLDPLRCRRRPTTSARPRYVDAAPTTLEVELATRATVQLAWVRGAGDPLAAILDLAQAPSLPAAVASATAPAIEAT